jgi:hypothetical protein
VRELTASVTIAAKSVESDTPARIRRLESIPPPRRASAATSNRRTETGDKADPGRSGGRDSRHDRDRDCGRSGGADAGEIGSTSGLRSIPCRTAPQSASDAPTVAAMQTRGNRSCHTIVCSTPVACG